MMRKILGYWREAACVVLLSLLCWLLTLWTRMMTGSDLSIFLYVLSVAADMGALYWLLRSLWRRKWSLLLQKAMQAVLTRTSDALARLFDRLFGKWTKGGRKKGNVLVGRTQIRFESRLQEQEEKKGSRKRKWKHMENERERMRYLYRHMVTGKIASGVPVYRYDTPCEAKERSENTETENELFALYTALRYDERSEADDEVLQKIREELHVR